MGVINIDDGKRAADARKIGKEQDEDRRVPRDKLCPSCHGLGVHTCSCGNEHTCSRCGGSGGVID